MKCYHPSLNPQSLNCNERLSPETATGGWKSNSLLQELSLLDMNAQLSQQTLLPKEQAVEPKNYIDPNFDTVQHNPLATDEWGKSIASSVGKFGQEMYGNSGIDKASKFVYDILPLDLISNGLSYLSPSQDHLSQLGNSPITKDRKNWDGTNTCGQTALAMLLLSRSSKALLYPVIAQKMIENQKSKKSKNVLIKEMIANPNVLSENLVYLYNSTTGSSAVLKKLGDEILSAVDKEQISRESYGDGSAFAKGWDAKKILTQDKYRGKTAILSTGMTGSGHFVVLQQVHSDGITIHDPYGAKISSHLNESKTAKSLRSLANKPASKEILERRFSKNGRLPSLMKIDPKEALPSDIGENVFFSWEECDAYKIGCVVTG